MAVHVVELQRPISNVELQGFGAQFDCDLFTRRGQPKPLTPAQLAALKAILRPLKLGHSRILVAKKVLTERTERNALFKTLDLAQDSGANVNLTWWAGPYFRGSIPNERNPCRKRTKKAVTGQDGEWPFIGKERMTGFADVIEEAREMFDCVKYVTVQNEVNAHDIGLQCRVAVSQRLYKRLYAILDDELRKRPDPRGLESTLRDTVDFVGGDLVRRNPRAVKRSDQEHWLRFMRDEMTRAPSKLLDGYSIHVYWSPPPVEGFNWRTVDKRMNGLRAQIRVLGLDKPIYVTEYGVKSSPNRAPGQLGGQNMEDTVASAFEHAWFNALAPQCGCIGLSKWALYRTDGPNRPFRGWGMIRPPKHRFAPLPPTYYVTLLFNSLIDVPGWKAAGVWRSPDRRVLVGKFAARKGGDHSIVALNRGAEVTLELRGLKPSFEYASLVWNRRGDAKPGTIRPGPPVVSNARRVARVTVGRGELVAISTRSPEV